MSKANSAGQGAGPGSGSGPMMQGAGGKSIEHARGDRRFRGLAYRLHNRVKTVSDSIQAAQGIVTKA